MYPDASAPAKSKDLHPLRRAALVGLTSLFWLFLLATAVA